LSSSLLSTDSSQNYGGAREFDENPIIDGPLPPPAKPPRFGRAKQQPPRRLRLILPRNTMPLSRVVAARQNYAINTGSGCATNLSFRPARGEVRSASAGGRWDADSKRWYIDADEASARFSRWLSASEQREEYIIASTEACVAAAVTACQRCRSRIEVICVHCASGTVSGEPLHQFTVSDIWAMDDALARQLQPWPTFRWVDSEDEDGGYFVNHCPLCGAPQEDMYLHSEPDEPFFNIPGAAPDSIKLTPLTGSIELSGNEHFEV
jgi:hypothetical protein